MVPKRVQAGSLSCDGVAGSARVFLAEPVGGALDPSVAPAGHEQSDQRRAREDHLKQPLPSIHRFLLSRTVCI
jgi:hypothetical protein